MTEREWADNAELDGVLDLVIEIGSARKIRLCLAAGLRAVAAELDSHLVKAVVRAADAAERYADGLLSLAELAAEEAIAGYAVKDWLPGPESPRGETNESWICFQLLQAHTAAEWALAL